MIRPIVKYGTSVLHQAAEPVAEVTGDQVALTVDEVWPVRDAAEAEEKLQNLKQARQGQAREV